MTNVTTSVTALASRMDGWARSLGTNPIKALKTFDFKTVGIVGAGILITVLLIDLIGYLFAAYNGTRRSYVPVSRNIVNLATGAWDNRSSNLIGDYFNPYVRSRSLEPVGDVLDALSAAWQKWGDDLNVIATSKSQ